jgi:hypothetical protein
MDRNDNLPLPELFTDRYRCKGKAVAHEAALLVGVENFLHGLPLIHIIIQSHPGENPIDEMHLAFISRKRGSLFKLTIEIETSFLVKYGKFLNVTCV